MEDIEFLLKIFDFRKDVNICSFKNCKNKYFDSFIITKTNIKKQIKKDLAEVKICENHLKEKGKLINILNEKFAKDFWIYSIKIKK
ncbi:MAG: hypothetical protein QXF15_01905 [Candidatus Aenigmatarchaeota archaeon]|nr:hypothetical protein [Candidatus Aenigmarchaeota archaeon]